MSLLTVVAQCADCHAIATVKTTVVNGETLREAGAWKPDWNVCKHENLTTIRVIPKTCCRCGKEPTVHRDDADAYCEDCHTDHDFQYSRDDRERRCTVCDKPAPPDHYAYQD